MRDVHITEANYGGGLYVYGVMVDGQLYDTFYSQGSLTWSQQDDVVAGYKEALMSFDAQYPGECAHRCERGIRPGDKILATMAWPGYVHAGECPESVDDLSVIRQPCQTCFQVPANNGTCGCED